MSDVLTLVSALQRANVVAFIGALRIGEGTDSEDGYRKLFGGGTFESFADHPRQKITRTIVTSVRKKGKLVKVRMPITSTAAGAYQILEGTWDELVARYGFSDFSPRNQDLAAVALVLRRGALDDVLAGRLEDAVKKCAKEWASLPWSPYGQPVVKMDVVTTAYLARGGALAAGGVEVAAGAGDGSAQGKA